MCIGKRAENRGSLALANDAPFVLLGVGFRDHVLPKIARLTMPLEHFAALLLVGELDLSGAFVNPIEKELSRALADPPLVTELDEVRPGHGETVCFGQIGHGTDQKPAALVEREFRQPAAFGIDVEHSVPFFMISR